MDKMALGVFGRDSFLLNYITSEEITPFDESILKAFFFFLLKNGFECWSAV